MKDFNTLNGSQRGVNEWKLNCKKFIRSSNLMHAQKLQSGWSDVKAPSENWVLIKETTQAHYLFYVHATPAHNAYLIICLHHFYNFFSRFLKGFKVKMEQLNCYFLEIGIFYYKFLARNSSLHNIFMLYSLFLINDRNAFLAYILQCATEKWNVKKTLKNSLLVMTVNFHFFIFHLLIHSLICCAHNENRRLMYFY